MGDYLVPDMRAAYRRADPALVPAEGAVEKMILKTKTNRGILEAHAGREGSTVYSQVRLVTLEGITYMLTWENGAPIWKVLEEHRTSPPNYRRTSGRACCRRCISAIFGSDDVPVCISHGRTGLFFRADDEGICDDYQDKDEVIQP